ncbi:MAG: hypothetical protein QM767_16015 [Anaeromyxobacter sp.]
MTRSAGLLLAAISALAGTAHAQEKAPSGQLGVVAVAPAPGPNPGLVSLTGALHGALSARTAAVVDPGELRLRMGDLGSVASLEETNRAYEAARAAELSGNPLAAISGLESAVAELEKMTEGPEVFTQWKRAVIRLARIESLLAGHEEKARTTLEKLYRADPDAKVDAAAHGSDVAQLADSIKAKLSRAPRRRLTLTSSTPGARFFVNGREVGTNAGAPVQTVVVAGTHRVSATDGTLRVTLPAVDLSRDQVLDLDFTVARMVRPGMGPGLAIDPLDKDSIFRAAGSLRLSTLITTSLIQADSATYLVGSAYDVGKGQLRQSGVMHLANSEAPPGGMNALADYLLTGTPAGGVKKFDPASTDWRQEPPKTKRNVAIGTAIGGVALGAVSVWQLLASNSSYDKANGYLSGGVLPADDSPYWHYKEQGDKQRTVATATGIGAGVCLVTSAVTGYLAYKQSGEFGPIRF